METPSIPDTDGEFCWELDVEIGFRLEERHVFIIVWKFQPGVGTKELLDFFLNSHLPSSNGPG